MQRTSGKKLAASFSPLLLIVIAVGIFLPHTVHAYDFWSWFGNKAIDIAAGVWAYLFYVIQSILIAFLTIISYIVDNLFWYNVILNPTNMPAVKAGWVIMRDIANGLFLLLIVYIAIQIIWGVGKNDKRLLVRVIIIAFLINFSLAITGAVFGFGNALARPFQKALGNDVAGFIISATKINTIQKASTPNEIQQAKIFADGAMTSGNCPLSGMTTFNAGTAGCAMGSAVTSVMGELAGYVGTAIKQTSVQETIAAGIACIFLVLIVLMYCGVAAFLIVRIVMMAFLGAVSAGAFFLSAIPHTGTKKLFDDWLQALIGWAFIAPAFYFLFYLSLLMLAAMTSVTMTPPGTISLTANLFDMLPFVIFLFFIKTTMNICKKLGGKIAESAIAMGQTVGKVALGAAAGVATGGASLALSAAGGAAARGMQQKVEGGMERLAATPVLGKLTAPLTNRVRGYYQQRNSEIDKKKTEYDGMNTRDLVQTSKTTLSTDNKVAIAEVLQKRGQEHFDKLGKSGQEKAIGYSNQFGRENLLAARPDLATAKNVYGAKDDTDAKKKVLNRMTPEQKSKNISRHALADDSVKQAFLETATTKDIQEMMKNNAEMTEKIIYEYFNTQNTALNTELQAAMKNNPQTFDFIKSSMRIQTGQTAYNEKKADEDERRRFRVMQSEEKAKIGNTLTDDRMKRLFLETASVGDIEAMAKHNAEMTEKIIYEYFDKNQLMLRKAMQENPQTFEFINSNKSIQSGREEYAKKKAASTP